MRTRGKGVKKSENFVDVMYGCSLNILVGQERERPDMMSASEGEGCHENVDVVREGA